MRYDGCNGLDHLGHSLVTGGVLKTLLKYGGVHLAVLTSTHFFNSLRLLQYHRRFPIPRRDQAISDSGNVQALTEDEQSTAGIHHDHCHYDRQTISRKLPSLQAGAYESCPGMKQSFASLSLPSLGVSMGASWPNEVDRIDGRVDSEKHDQNVQPAASMRRRVWGRSGELTVQGDNKMWIRATLTNSITLGDSLRLRMVPAGEDVALRPGISRVV